MSALTPKQIVKELNKYIVGQKNAKRAVAIALRNRWRRQQVSKDMKDEIVPIILSSSDLPVWAKRRLHGDWPILPMLLF